MTGLRIIERQLAEMFGGITRDTVAADPHKHRKTTFTNVGSNGRRYYQYVNGKGQHVRFYRSTGRNIAGYFIIWRETEFKNGLIKNDMVRAFKTKKAAITVNRARYQKAKNKR